MHIIDSHILRNSERQPAVFPIYGPCWFTGARISGPVFMRRWKTSMTAVVGFDDNESWKATRKRAHDYLLQIACQNKDIYPYYFVWNDFIDEDLDRGFAGIKWHHHAGEPPYHYEDPRCGAMIDAIYERGLPVVLEETFDRTIWFIEQTAGRTVIIPHLQGY